MDGATNLDICLPLSESTKLNFGMETNSRKTGGHLQGRWASSPIMIHYIYIKYIDMYNFVFQQSSEHEGPKLTKTAKAGKNKPILKDPSVLILQLQMNTYILYRSTKTAQFGSCLVSTWNLRDWVQVGRPSEQTWTLTAQTSPGLQWPCSEPSEWSFTAFGPALQC